MNCIALAVLGLMGLTGLAAGAAAQATAVVVDRGPGAPGRIVADALAGPHRLVEPDTSWFVLEREAREPVALIVLGRTAAVSGTIESDVIVVGGDLFLRPGARITGSAVAIGGAVYSSTLSLAERGTRSFRDETFAVTRTGAAYQLSYRSLRENATPALRFPGFYGLRLPSYDRVNGASVPFGPELSFAGGRGEVTALATYRSDLGELDPSLAATFQITPRLRAVASVGRGTFSNDRWIWDEFVNSLSSLVLGTDTRNYYRADRAELAAYRTLETQIGQVEPFAGIRHERAWSVGPHLGATSGPWSVLRRRDSLGMLRPNPEFASNAMTSAVTGARLSWESGGLRVTGASALEQSLNASGGGPLGSLLEPIAFTQITSSARADFVTIGTHEYRVDLQWVTTMGDTPPPQRFVYFGGPGTMPFLDLLEQGGDELLLVDQQYSVPLDSVQVGKLGSPTVFLRHRLGSAGLGSLPAFAQALSAGVQLSLLRGEMQLNPANGAVRFSLKLAKAR